MRAAVKPRAARHAGHQVRKFRGFVLTRLGQETIEITMPSGAVWGWGASWTQARRVVDWLVGQEARSRP